ITIVLLAAEADQIESRFDSLHTEIESMLCRKLARWIQDHFVILQACDPVMPTNAYNRLADNWRPLFAIAQTAGGDWPRRALEAFNYLTNQRCNALAAPKQSAGRSQAHTDPIPQVPFQSQIKNQKSQIALLAAIRSV